MTPSFLRVDLRSDADQRVVRVAGRDHRAGCRRARRRTCTGRRSPYPSRGAPRTGCSCWWSGWSVYAPLIAAHLERDADLAGAAWMTGTMRVVERRGCPRPSARSCRRRRCTCRSAAGSYFDCFISAAALSTSPASFGVAYGSYSASPLLYITGGDDVRRDRADDGTAPGLAEGALVHDQVHRLAHVDVVERCLSQVHRQVPRAVADVREQPRLERRIRHVLRGSSSAAGSTARRRACPTATCA